MKCLQPGVYDDEQGGLHINAGELLRANGWPDTPTNREVLVGEAVRLFQSLRPTTPVVVTDDPIPEVP
jgi:hypothetical protein